MSHLIVKKRREEPSQAKPPPPLPSVATCLEIDAYNVVVYDIIVISVVIMIRENLTN